MSKLRFFVRGLALSLLLGLMVGVTYWRQHTPLGTADLAERDQKPGYDAPDAAWLFRQSQLVDENGKIPEGALMAANAQARELRLTTAARTPSVGGIVSGTWTWLGPGNIGGRVRALVIHPTDVDRMWAGSVSGGMWTTTDGGSTWAPMDDFMANLAVTTLVLDPTDADTLYAGTGEGFSNSDAIRGAGVFSSTDGGVTWVQLSATNNSNWYYVNRLAIHPTTPQILLAATSTGVYSTTDSGVTWSKVLTTTNVYDIDFHPGTGATAVAGGNNAAWYSNDGGATWAAATLPSAAGRIEVAYAPSSPTTVYASANVNSGEIWRSLDSGQTYAVRNTGNSFLGTQGWYDNVVWVDPTNANNLIVGGIDLWRSGDAGLNLTKISQWQIAPAFSAHADHHIIVAQPGFDGTVTRTVFFGNDGGVYKTLNVYGVITNSGWVELNNNLGITQFYGGAVNTTTQVILGGTQDNGTLRYNGATETWTETFGGDGGFNAADPTDPNYFYGEYIYLRIFRSTDGGRSGSYITTGLADANTCANFIAPFILDPNNANRLLGGGCGLWRTDNVKAATPTWTNILTATGSNISAIAVTPGNSDSAWAGTNNGNVYSTTNGTAGVPTWNQIDNGLTPLPNRMVTRIVVDPMAPGTVYVTFGGFAANNVWKTTDGGLSWAAASGSGGTALPSAPVYAFAVNPVTNTWVYAGTEVGVLASEDGGATWGASNDGPANVAVFDLMWLNNRLIVVTHGRGMYATDGLVPLQPPANLACSTEIDGDGVTDYSTADAQAVRDAFNGVAAGGTIRIAGYCAGVSNGTVLRINKNITLTGGYTTTNWLTSYPLTQPTTLDALGAGPVILAPFSNVTFTLQGFTITNGISNTGSSQGGGLYAGGGVTLTGMTLYSNTANSTGGGAYFLGVAHITGTTFTSNTAGTNGGGAYFTSSGAPYLTNTLFISNLAASSGGGAFFNGQAGLTNTTFLSNTATGLYGGGAYFNGLTTMNGGSFTANAATNAANGYGGGALFTGATAKQLVNVLFARNHANNFGAAIFVFNATPLSLLHSTIVSSTAPTGGIQAVYVNGGVVNITNTVVATHTRGFQRGGGTINDWNTLFSGVPTPYNGTSITSLGGITGTAAFVNSATDNYHLTASSSALNAGTPPTPNVTTDFEGDARPQSGSYDIGYDELYVPPVCFTEYTGDTTTDFSSSDAQAVRDALGAVTAGGTVKVAGTCAGAVAQSGSTQVALITKTVTVAGGYTTTAWNTYNPTGNPTTLDAQNGGRVISTTAVAVTLQGFTVTRGLINAGAVSQNGGGIFAAGAVTLTDLTVYSNTINGTGGTQNGGGAYLTGAALITNATFLSNTARNDGGGVYLAGTALLTNTTFAINTTRTGVGGSGGGVYAASTFHATATTFRNNTGDHNGGGAYFGSTTFITASTFTTNTAPGNNGGGAFFNSTTSITGTLFSGNVTGIGGGGAELRGRTYVTNTSFINNRAVGGGGVGLNAGGNLVQFVNTLFARNRANSEGNAIRAWSASPLNLLHVTIVSPTLAAGPAVYANSNTFITNTIVVSHATGIQQVGGTVIAWNTLFFGNTADTSGSVTSNSPVSGDPLFVNPATDNYHINTTSPARNAGTLPSPDVTRDIDGAARPQNGSYDIGYDEVADTAAVVVDDSYSTQMNTTLTVIAPGLTANDSDVDGDPLAPTRLVTAPTTGTLSLKPNGSLVYTPALNFTGVTTFTYHIGNDNLALDFDGTNDYAIAPVTGTALTQFTVEMWVKRNSVLGGQRGIFQWANVLAAGTPFILFADSGANFRFYVNGNYLLDTPLATGQWTYFAATYGAAGWKFYKNGVLAGTAGLGLGNQVNALNLYFGNGFNGYWNGQIDESRFWNVELTQTQIQANLQKRRLGNEAGLLAYYRFDDPTGTNTALNEMNSGLGAVLTNMDPNTDWVAVSPATMQDYALSNTATVTLTVAGACSATPNDGGTVYTSADAQAVRDAVTAASAGGTVKIAGYCAGVSGNEVVYVNKVLTLTGGYTLSNWSTYNPTLNPTTLDAVGGGRVVYADALVTLQGFTATNGVRNADGGGIYASVPMTLTDMAVYSNTSTTNAGGGVYANSTLTAQNSRFITNTAVGSGGGAQVNGNALFTSGAFTDNTAIGNNGGGLNVNGTLTLNGGTFYNNRCTGACSGGGAAAGNFAATLTGTQFISNTGGFNGGGLVAAGATMTNVAFFRNRAANGSGGGYANFTGGTVTLSNPQFISNTATDSGGAIYSLSSVTDHSGVYQQNIAGNLRVGGGLYLNAGGNLSGTQLISNTFTSLGTGNGCGSSGACGGGIYVAGGATTLINATFSGNTASVGGGGAIGGSLLNIQSTTFSNNTANADGGGFSAGNTSLQVTGTTFLNNTAGTVGGGAAFWNTAALTNTIFTGNTATNSGGGAYFNSTTTIIASTFTTNTSTTSNGGGAYVNAGLLTLTGAQFIANTATGGAGVWQQGGNAHVSNSRFERGTSGNVSGLVVLAGTLNMTDTLVLSNTTTVATTSGAFYVGGSAVITGGVFQGNVGLTYAGGPYFAGAATVTGTQFIANRGGQGGAVTLGGSAPYWFTNVLFARNAATAGGTAVHVLNAAPLRLLHSTIASPTVAGTSAIYVAAGTVYLTNTLIATHTTGIQNVAGTVTAWNTLFDNVSTQTTGGVTNNAPVTGAAAFFDPATDDYHLTGGSAAINAGTAPTPNVPNDVDGDIRPNGGLPDIGYDEAYIYISDETGDWGTAGTWDVNSVPNSPGAIVIISQTHTVTVESNFRALRLWVRGGLVVAQGNVLTVTLPVSNAGVIRMIRPVSNANVAFEIPSGGTFPAYRLVGINTSGNLGVVTATVWGLLGGEFCTAMGGSSPNYARRCFEVTPTITTTAATVRLWVLNSELNGLAQANLYVYRYTAGWGQLLTNRLTGNDGDTYTWVEGETPGFSFFLAGGPSAPTAVTLSAFDAAPRVDWGRLALALLAFLAALGVWRWHQRGETER